MADNDFSVEIPQHPPGADPNGPGQPAYLNNNPGNIKYAGQPGTEPGTPAADGGVFAKFKTPEEGYRYLRDQHIPKFNNRTLAEHISHYAPPGSNDTNAYITNASKNLGVPPDTPVEKLDHDKLAQFQIQLESGARVRAHDEFDAALAKPEPDEFDHALAAKPGEIPAPSGTPKTRNTTWNPQHDVLENVSDQLEDVAGRVGRNVGDAATGVAQGAKDIYHQLLSPFQTHTPQELEAQRKEFEKQINRPLGEQIKDLPVVGPLSEGAFGAAAADALTGYGLSRLGKGRVGNGAVAEEAAAPLSDRELINQQILQKVNEQRPIPPEYAGGPVRLDKLEASTKPLTEALNPANASDFQNIQSKRLIPLLKAEEPLVGPITDPKTMRRALDTAKVRNRMEFQPYVDQAEAHGLQLSGDDVANAMNRAIPKQLDFEHPEIAAKMRTDANLAYKGKTLSPSQVQQFIETNNAKLKAYFDAKGDVQNAQSLTQAQKAVTLAQQDAYHNILYKSIDPVKEGANVAELQKRYGALAEGEKSLGALEDKIAKEPTSSGVLQKTKAGLGYLSKAVNLEHPLEIRNLIPEESTSGKIARAFKSYPKEGMLKDVPAPDVKNLPISWHLEGSEPAGFSRQRGLNEQSLPASRMDTDYRQQTQEIPSRKLNLTKEEPPPTFNWQKFLFGEDPKNPEKATAINPRKLRKPPNPSHPTHASGTPPPVEDETPFRFGPW